jgi:hypothetical protein
MAPCCFPMHPPIYVLARAQARTVAAAEAAAAGGSGAPRSAFEDPETAQGLRAFPLPEPAALRDAGAAAHARAAVCLDPARATWADVFVHARDVSLRDVRCSTPWTPVPAGLHRCMYECAHSRVGFESAPGVVSVWVLS